MRLDEKLRDLHSLQHRAGDEKDRRVRFEYSQQADRSARCLNGFERSLLGVGAG